MNAKLIVSMIAAAWLAGCAAAQAPWQHASLPKDQWQSDWLRCKRWAEDQVGYQDDSSSPLRDYDRSQAKRRINGYVDFCMRDQGYVPSRSSR